VHPIWKTLDLGAPSSLLDHLKRLVASERIERTVGPGPNGLVMNLYYRLPDRECSGSSGDHCAGGTFGISCPLSS
jgi:hypothetical protein